MPRVQDVDVPDFLYGTAWKEGETHRLVTQALRAGFRGVDTANQRKHYFEAAVGDALKEALAQGLNRKELFVQTKFTHRDGQDARLPYDPKARVSTQVQQSFESSLAHLHVGHLDALVLHGPSVREGLAPQDVEAWRAMEGLYAQGGTRLLGVSNVSAEQLLTLCTQARVVPALVQNRCFARYGWDAKVRAVCRERGILYQGFSLLTANQGELLHPEVARIARRLAATPAQVVFAFARQVGMVCLTGSSDPAHLAEDLASSGLTLTAEEVGSLEALSGG